ncbi:MAG: GGDEF domain-containing protein [Sandaracinaceae bacterium]|nr:GGDEF domain-containing protein [Sandaracinaceae bacterium]
MATHGQKERLQLLAAWSRIVLGLTALGLLPLLYDGLETAWPIFAGYVAAALVGQVLIYKGIGGDTRSFLGGVVDMAAVAFLVHRVGSMGTMLVALFYFAVIVHTLVVGRRVGVGLALVATGLYGGVAFAEQAGVLPYGPNAPQWAATRPGATDALVGVALLSATLLGSAGIVGLLASRIREREAELRALAARLEALSQRDPLTQLYNRRHLMERLDAELARVRRGRPLAVVMLDLDRFKRVNDERGHQQGDEILGAIAGALRDATREVDVPGRYGGDEFLVLLPDTSAASARQVAERLAAAVREVGERFDAELPVTASVGLAFARPGDEARALIQRADQRSYEAKQAGGDRVAAEPAPAEWDPEDESRVRTRETPQRVDRRPVR